MGLSVLVAGCSVTPLVTPLVQGKLSHTYVENIPERWGQYLHMSLRRKIAPFKTPVVYKLYVTLDEKKSNFAINADGTVARVRMTITASYRLVQAHDQREIDAGEVVQSEGYNVVFGSYLSSTTVEEFTRRLIMDELAEDLFQRVAEVFSAFPKIEHLNERKEDFVQKESSN